MKKQCENCHSVFEIKPSRVSSGRGRFCSRSCCTAWRNRFKNMPLGSFKKSANGCWLWLGGKDGRGYGVAWNGKHWEKAHRLYYKIFRGPIPVGLSICHHCDNPPCINPAHLFVGTQKDNVRDAISKNRFSYPKIRPGHKNPNAKLTPNQVRAIRSRYSFRKCTSKQLGREYNVSPTVILMVVHRHAYKNVG